ncbi:MAG: hypothetical protein QOF76_2097 [Solirubrobacteraceae bacterium]|nr:hypothetical protein [Solirubrobacteraceae bacterium]
MYCAEMRPWALRQARRSYRHLPTQLREQAVDRAMQELRTSAPASFDRRGLTAELAELLTESLRHVHVGWCLNESAALLRREGGSARDSAIAPRDGLAEFVDSGLGGLERAVLQLEIGAGRDSRTTRAALRLGPREYGRHREEGLSKLRDAISARIIGRVCDQHVTPVVLAATGDRRSAANLAGGTNRCRACAREAQGIRAVLNERLAIAPWPLVIKPAGVLAAKFGALGAVFGSKSAGGAGLGALGTSSGASAAATVVAAAALATGGVAMIGNGKATPRERAHTHAAKHTQNVAAHAPSAAAAHTPAVLKSVRRSVRAQSKHAHAAVASTASTRLHTRVTTSHKTHTAARAPVTTAPVTAPTTVAATNPPVTKDPVGAVTGGVNQTVQTLGDTVKGVTKQLPPVVQQPLDQTLDNVQQTVDDVGKTLNGVLGNKP